MATSATVANVPAAAYNTSQPYQLRGRHADHADAPTAPNSAPKNWTLLRLPRSHVQRARSGTQAGYRTRSVHDRLPRDRTGE